MLTTYQAKLSSCVSGVSGLPTDSDNLQPALKALVKLSVAFPLCCLTFRGAITRKTVDIFFRQNGKNGDDTAFLCSDLGVAKELQRRFLALLRSSCLL